MRRIVKTPDGWGMLEADHIVGLQHPLGEMLQGAPIEIDPHRHLPPTYLAPVDRQEVWAAGVTYQRSLQARAEESREPDVYERVYTAERPELFFKSLPHRVVGQHGIANIRSDSTWDVPEAEIVLVLDAKGEIWGYTIGDDVSSRSIEGENPLYLPQAKVYDGSAVVGPWIVPAADVHLPLPITLIIERAGEVVFKGDTSTATMARTFEDLASWLARGFTFEAGALLMTGTGVVPSDEFTLAAGDTVRIDVAGLGTLEHGIAVLDCSA